MYNPYSEPLNKIDTVLAEIGIGLTGLGFLFLFLGVLFFFDRGLIALGNVSLLLLALLMTVLPVTA